MKFHTLFFFRKLEKTLQNVSSAAVVIDALRVKAPPRICSMQLDSIFNSHKYKLPNFIAM